jgi:hypothetical protein
MLDDHEGMGVFDCLAGDEEYSGVRYVIFFQVKVSSETERDFALLGMLGGPPVSPCG